MNGKTAKLLRKYAQVFGEDYGQLKSEWYALNHIERGQRREEMKAEIRRSDSDVFIPDY